MAKRRHKGRKIIVRGQHVSTRIDYPKASVVWYKKGHAPYRGVTVGVHYGKTKGRKYGWYYYGRKGLIKKPA